MTVASLMYSQLGVRGAGSDGRRHLPFPAGEGGEPLEEQIVMWWNFVGRSREEISAAYDAWQAQDDRFGRVRSALPRIPAPPPYWSQPARD